MLLTERNHAHLHVVGIHKQNVGIIVSDTPASLNGFGLFTQECFETPLVATSTLVPSSHHRNQVRRRPFLGK